MDVDISSLKFLFNIFGEICDLTCSFARSLVAEHIFSFG